MAVSLSALTFSTPIPDIEPLQGALVTALLSAAQHYNANPSLISSFSTPRLGFGLPPTPETYSTLRRLAAQGLMFADTATRADIDLSKTPLSALPANLLLYHPILCAGRVIHGPLSGLELTLADMSKTKDITFPDARFGTQPANTVLSGQTLPTSRALLSSLKETEAPERLDVVYTWVDGADPNWSANRQEHSPNAPSADALHKARFDNNNELLYSLRALFRYLHGLHRVFLVTDAQVPVFLGEFADRITVVDHADIMGNDVARPTFNSHTIESCLHRIKGLAPQYLYLNDDFLFASPACPTDFFDPKGRAKCFFSNRSYIPKGDISDQTLAVDAAAINLRDLLADRYNHTITRKFQHTPVPTHRDILFEMEETFAEEFAQLRRNRFRSRNDLSPSSSFYLHYALMTDRAAPGTIKYRYYEVSARNLPLKLFKLSIEKDHQRPKVHCVNSTGDTGVGRLNSWSLRTHLEALYPAANTTRPLNTWADPWRQRLYHGLLSLRRKLRKRV